MRTLTFPLACLLLAAPAAAQQTEDPLVYISQYQVPWERTDSLAALAKMYPEWLAKARELGHLLDYQLWIHRYGDEWNVVTVWVYPTWDAWAKPKPGWGQEVFRMVEPDSAKRAAYNAGMTWVFAGTVHRDNIYRNVWGRVKH